MSHQGGRHGIDCGSADVWATGTAPVGLHGRLRSIVVPPAGRTARAIARRLAHPTLVFGEAGLDDEARRGFEPYRRLARAAVGRHAAAKPRRAELIPTPGGPPR